MFLNPIMLAAGVAGALVPLVLHLLSRARYRTVEWGAMMFLSAGDLRQRESPRVQQAVLLALRMATLGLLGVALARPLVGAAATGRDPAESAAASARPGRTTAVICFDRSESMALDENGRTRLDLAREAVFQILATLRPGDQVALVPLGEGQTPPDESNPAAPATSPVPAFTTDFAEIERRVGDWPASGAGDVAAGLRRCADLLARASGDDVRLFLVCDRQATGWAGVTPAFAADFRARLAALPAVPRFFVVPVGSADFSREASNVAVQSVAVANPPAIADLPTEVSVRVHNFGPVARAAVPITLRVPGRAEMRSTIHLDPDADAEARFPVTFPEPCPQLLTADLGPAPGLRFDKTFPLAVDVAAPIKVLLVSGDERETPAGSESEYARLALNPFRNPKLNPVVLAVVPWQAWNEWDLDRYQVVILANVPAFTAAQARALEQYVYDGGGLFVALGDLVEPDNYNRTLYADGAGLLPVGLEAAPARDLSDKNTLAQLDVTSPVLRFLEGRPDPAPPATVGQYFNTTLHPETEPGDFRPPPTPPAPAPPATGPTPETPMADGRVLASYAVGGEPFLIERTAGRGKVLLMTTSLDADWNDLPLTGFFLPFMQAAVRDLARPTTASRNLDPGRPLVERFAAPIDPRATIELPNHTRAPAEVTVAAGRSEARFADTSRPGVYRLFTAPAGQPGQARAIDFVVRPPAGESDLAPLTADQWERFGNALGFRRVETAGAALKADLESAQAGRELWLPLLAAAVGLSLFELLLSRAWSTSPARA